MTDSLALFQRAVGFQQRTAIVCPDNAYTFGELRDGSTQIAAALLRDEDDLAEDRVAFLAPPGFEYVATQWGIWRAGGIAVPLGMMHPEAEWEYVLDDAQISTVLAHPDHWDRLRSLATRQTIRLLSTAPTTTANTGQLPRIDRWRRAMILYTSGTTSRPKGVVITHANIQAQVEALVEAWEWTSDDHILHVLPLHHIHGIINVLTCALWSGAKCEFLWPFNADAVCDRFARGDLTLFMAVPTIYSKLIAAWEQATPQFQEQISLGCGNMRLMVSGSAALPVSTLQKWKSITGHVLLERYGMTEIGMALSNPLHGRRVPGHVGTPLPNVELRRVDDAGDVLSDAGFPGEIEVRGPAVFAEYWDKPEQTISAFHDGWFRTGDVAVIENGVYRLLGRSNVDIIKTGGYKVSALEVEDVLRTHNEIKECAVVGVPDEEWGQRVAACIVTKDGAELPMDSLRRWAKLRLAVYKVPTRLFMVDQLPRNAMGKVQKSAVVAWFKSK